MTIEERANQAAQWKATGIYNCAQAVTQAFANQIPVGALLLVSDQPMISTGVKTEESDKKITRDFVEEHVLIGVEALKLIIDKRTTVKHLRFDEE